jgi:uncharacterized protein YeaO (DUF488 family)
VQARIYRKWFSHNPKKLQQFRGKYFAEMLKKPGVMHILVDLVPEKPTATFLFTAHDKERNSAAALKMYLNDKGLLG